MYIMASISIFSAVLSGLVINYFDQLNNTFVFVLFAWMVLLFLFTQYIYNIGKRKNDAAQKAESAKEIKLKNEVA